MLRVVLIALLAALASPASAFETFQDCADCPTMVWLPPGSFVMGADADEWQALRVPARNGADEAPKHRVYIAGRFALGETEVTRGAFAAFVRATGHAPPPGCWKHMGSKWTEQSGKDWQDPGYVQDDRHAVVCVSWGDAQAYARWLSTRTGRAYRLPTEAEWEYAARAGVASARFWGQAEGDACRYANVADLTGAEVLNWRTGGNVFPCRDGHV